MKRNRSFFGLVFVALILMASCKKSDPVDLTTLQTYHSVAIPLVSAEIDVADMLAADTGDVISTGGSGELFLAYTSPDVNITAGEIITIPDESFSVQIAPAAAAGIGSLPSFSANASFQDTSTSAFTFPNNEELTSIDFSQGILTISITNSLSHDVSLTITIPSLQNSGVIYSDNLSAAANNTAITQANLSNYIMDLTQGSLGFNELLIYLDGTVSGSGAPINVADQVTLDFSLNGMDFDVIYGDLKYQQFDLDAEEITFNIFQNSSSAIDFQLTNPEIKLTIENSFGFSALIGMDSMYYEDLSGTFIDNILYDSSSSGNLAAAPFYFPIISKPSSQGSSTTTVISMNANNSSIDQLINATPKQMISSPLVAINTDTTIVNDNYVLNSSELNMSTEITLPLEGYAGGWMMGDTLPFDFKVDELFSSETSINEAVIKFVTTNGWPVEVGFTLQLLDSSQNILSSIADEEMIIESGVLDANGKVVTPTVKPTELFCDSNCVNNLNQTKYVIISVEANTSDYTNQQAVKIYEDYKLGISMALLVSGRMF